MNVTIDTLPEDGQTAFRQIQTSLSSLKPGDSLTLPPGIRLGGDPPIAEYISEGESPARSAQPLIETYGSLTIQIPDD